MSILIIFVQLLFTIPLFFLIEYFNKKNISIIEKILIPVIYIVLVAAFCTDIKNSIYLIVIFEFIFHCFYISNIENKDILINKKEYYINSIISIILSVFIYDYYISEVDSVLPLASEFRSMFWFLIIIFIYNLFKDNIKKVEVNDKNNFIDRKREYVVVMYARFKNKYYRVVKSKNNLINNLIYSIMIYENYRVPKMRRCINNFIDKFDNKNSRYGIMQIEYKYKINDEESIKLVLSRLDKKIKTITNTKKKAKDIIIELLNDQYNKKEIDDLVDIYNEIIEFESR